MIDAAYIGLGANLGEPEVQMRDAKGRISRLEEVRLLGCSSLYRTSPIGFSGQPDYLNAVISVETSVPPETLLNMLLEIEREMGRARVQGERDQPRIIDCDLLLYRDQQYHDRDLQLPHPRMTERLFVLTPLLELAPRIVLPGAESIRTLCERCRAAGQQVDLVGEF